MLSPTGAELGEEDPRVASTLHDLGRLETASGNYEEARKRFLRALEIQRASLSPTDPKIALTLTSLGQMLRTAGSYDSALV